MVSVGAGGVSWAAAGSLSPDVTLISSIIFIFLILTLLSLCTNCGRQEFNLENSPEAETPSTLLRVVKIGEDPGTRENPYITDITKDEKAFVLPTSTQSGEVWFTPWRTHSEILRPQGDINNQTGVPTPPCDRGPIREMTPVVVVAPPRMEVGPALQLAPPQRLSHAQSAPRRTADPLGPKDGLNSAHQLSQANGIPSNPSQSLWRLESPAPHTYESLGEVREAASQLPAVSVGKEPEDHLYNTVEGLSLPFYWPDQQGGNPGFLTPPTSTEGEEDESSGMSLNAVYARTHPMKRRNKPHPCQRGTYNLNNPSLWRHCGCEDIWRGQIVLEREVV
ncbi:hypothetical protein AAFF_G00202890 [Aldrovandia affinis]|uniref:Uncharacterized protein n=1 Tax=Aldrovandia affinis TaxID=143900 RepID=A0AAD7WV96_9TELE|nr:hypothetical protein AAFF_G00202890 [Aldrovandia affinis]